MKLIKVAASWPENRGATWIMQVSQSKAEGKLEEKARQRLCLMMKWRKTPQQPGKGKEVLFPRAFRRRALIPPCHLSREICAGFWLTEL